jgi:tetratricopeptide (TPR) repeat protein
MTAPWIIATILLDDCGELVVPAIESVLAQVDAVLCLDTTTTKQGKNKTMALARKVAGGKFLGHALLLRRGESKSLRRGWNGSAADARNYALRSYSYTQARRWDEERQEVVEATTYMLTLDTDERMIWNGLDLRGTLEQNPEIETWLLPSADGTPYTKERVIRSPAAGRWIGRTHEGYFGPAARAVLPLASFTEIAKTPEQYAARFERDIPLLLAEIADRPDDARWRYYLGDTYHNLGRYEEAVRLWTECAILRGWQEEGAWACYRAATDMEEQLHQRPQARDMVGLGLARQITPELAWLGALLAHRDGRQRDAILLASLAVNAARMGEERVGFRAAEAWTYKPYEVLHYAHAALGNEEEAEKFRLICDHERKRLEGV